MAAGRHGRKTGRGYYDYGGVAGGGRYRAEDPPPPEPPRPGSGEGVVVIAGEGALADELRAAAARRPATRCARRTTRRGGELPALIVECDREPADGDGAPARRRREAVAGRPPQAARCCCARGSLAALDPGGSAVGFHVLPPLAAGRPRRADRAATSSSPLAAARAERFFAALGKHVAWVGDAPGLVLGRIVCQVVNECGVRARRGRRRARADIDAGMVLGLNHPRGPLEWADEIGLDHVLAVLDGAVPRSTARSATARRRCCAGWSRRGGSGARPAPGFFEYEAPSCSGDLTIAGAAAFHAP